MKKLMVLCACLVVFTVQSQHLLPRGPEAHLIENSLFVVNYSATHHQPYWVHYQLNSNQFETPLTKKDYYKKDQRIEESATKADYKYSGYDRGHLFDPEFAGSDLNVFKESYLLSGVCPQLRGFQRTGRVWQQLEVLEKSIAKSLDGSSLLVTSGPIFKHLDNTIGENRVTIPSAFFKVFFNPNDGESIAFLIDHQSSREDPFKHVISVSQLEAETGIDFHASLPPSIQNASEGTFDLAYWKLLSSGMVPETALDSSVIHQRRGDNFISIASFNIQIFGKTKSGKKEVMDTLATIVRAYDLVAMQEIKDKSQEVPKKFLRLVNAKGGDYQMVLSERTGKHETDRSSQEQYAYIYNAATISSLDEGMLYDDNQDKFQREPHLARFKARKGDFSFVMVNIHTRPEEALEEIEALHDVVEWARIKYSDEDDFIVVGDYNASCSYASSEELDELEIRSENYTWIIPDDADTNFASKDCAYDRIVITANDTVEYTGNWGVDRSFGSKKVSDHFPVWAEFVVTELK